MESIECWRSLREEIGDTLFCQNSVDFYRVSKKVKTDFQIIYFSV